MGEFALGQAVPRFEDPRLLRGGGRYVDDMVLPRMAFGYVLRSPYAHARIRSIDTSAAKAAPGVLAVLTGADWEASGWGDLPVPAGLRAARRRAGVSAALSGVGQGSGALGRRLRRLRRRRDPPPGRGRRRTDRRSITSRCRRSSRPRARSNRTRRCVWEEVPGQCRVLPHRGRRGKDRGSDRRRGARCPPPAGRQPRDRGGDGAARLHRRLQPRRTIRYTIYTTLQRTHSYRAELATQVMKVPESHVRVVAGDIGGSFGMKSAIYNEVPLVLLASKLVGRPVKWTSTRSEAFLGDAQARDNVSDGRIGARQRRPFPRLSGARRSRRSAPIRRSAPTRSSRISGPSPGFTARPRCAPKSPQSTPTPTRCGPIAAMAGRNSPTLSSAWSTMRPMNSASTRSNCAGAI